MITRRRVINARLGREAIWFSARCCGQLLYSRCLRGRIAKRLSRGLSRYIDHKMILDDLNAKPHHRALGVSFAESHRSLVIQVRLEQTSHYSFTNPSHLWAIV